MQNAKKNVRQNCVHAFNVCFQQYFRYRMNMGISLMGVSPFLGANMELSQPSIKANLK